MVMQALMKVLTYGFLFNGRKSYLRQPWNVLDFIVVVVGILILALENIIIPSDIIWMRAFRAMRCDCLDLALQVASFNFLGLPCPQVVQMILSEGLASRNLYYLCSRCERSA
jgi:hypothetical protein